MSDEQDPPALSLRPRKKPADDDAVAGSCPTDAEKPILSLKPKAKAASLPADTAEKPPPALSLKPKLAEPEVKPTEAPAVEPVKPRLKPKLSLGTDSATIPSAEEQPAEPEPVPPVIEAAEQQPPVVEHRDESNPAIDPVVLEALRKAKTEKPKLKLSISKPVETVASEEIPEEPAEPAPKIDLPPPPGFEKNSNLPPPVPVVTNELGESATAPPIPMPVDEDDDEDDDSEAPVRKRLRPEQRPIFKLVVVIIGIVLIGAIGAGGYMVYNIMFGEPDVFIKPTPRSPPVVVTPAEPAAEPTAEPAGPRSTAGKLIQKAQDAAASHEEVTDAVNAAMDDPETPAEVPVADTPEVTVDTAPATPVPSAAVLPSQNFQAWVSSAVISGVREGSRPRAFINSILVEQGDMVNAQFGITFDRVDAERNLVIFKDRTGAVVGKRY